MTRMVDVGSEVAGVVLSVTAGPGTRVAEGDEIMVIESMKMEIPVMAPVAGVVAAVTVAEGEAVAEAQLLARIEA